MKNKKEISSKIVIIIMVACYLFAGIILYGFRSYWDNNVQTFHISTEILCMAIISMIYVVHLGRKQVNDVNENFFTLLCVVIFIGLFFDLISWAIDGNVEYAWLNQIVNIITYLIVYAHGYIFFEYSFSYVENMSNAVKKIKNAIFVVLVIGYILRIIFLLTDQYFYIDEYGKYVEGPLFIRSYFLIPIICLFSCGVVGGTGISSRKLLTLIAYPLSTIFMLFIATINMNYANQLIAIALTIIFMYCATFVDAGIAKQGINEGLHIYLSEHLASKLEKNANLESSGSLVHASILFATLKGFSETMEDMDPEDAVVVLNHFFSEMNEIIEKSNGMLLEYPGYGIFCIFGEFCSCKDHAIIAIETACKMRDKMKDVNKWNITNHYPQIHLCIGINTGDIVLGDIGSANHLRYTAISKDVNLASRVESYGKNNEILITQNTVFECSKVIDAKLVNTIIPKGFDKPMNIFSVNGVVNE